MKNDRTFDCEPTLTDSQVIEFCRRGYMVFEGVVPEEVNQRTTDFLEEHSGSEPTELYCEDWFMDHVICNPTTTGAVRSLLGRDFHLPVLLSNHRRKWPVPWQQQEWHIDGNYKHGPALEYLQVFYYPQETPEELGPTELLPGSHFLRYQHRFMGHLDNLRYRVKTAAPAGSIFLTIYQIWHRGGHAQSGMRNNLKYFYWRTTPPTRDWIKEPDFDFSTADFELDLPTMGEDFKGGIRTAEMFFWLCGMHDWFQNLGGQSWPLLASNRHGKPYAFPEAR